MCAHIPSCAGPSWRLCFAPLQGAGGTLSHGQRGPNSSRQEPVPGASPDGSAEEKQSCEDMQRPLIQPACDLFIKVPPNAGLPPKQARGATTAS